MFHRNHLVVLGMVNLDDLEYSLLHSENKKLKEVLFHKNREKSLIRGRASVPMKIYLLMISFCCSTFSAHHREKSYQAQ